MGSSCFLSIKACISKKNHYIQEQEFKNNEALNDHIDREVHTITKAPDFGAFFVTLRDISLFISF